MQSGNQVHTPVGGVKEMNEVEQDAVVNAPEACTMEISPGSRKYWEPNCDGSLRPYVGQRFKTLHEGMAFYRKYAQVGGFDVRQSTVKRGRQGDITTKYLVCSREGAKGGGKKKLTTQGDGEPSKQRRRRVSNRVGCKVKIGFRKLKTGEFTVAIFMEKHNHCLCTESSRMFMKVNQKLDIGKQALIANCIRANIGNANCFRLCKEVAGSYENVGATSTEFRNFRRDLNAYIEGGDPQMLIERLEKKKEMCDEFLFDYYLDEENRLARLFWTDATARRNYAKYGDVMSFDATYGTNRYCMVFVPFTGVDNHKRCVTFGAGLLTKEDVDSYSWLLEKFKNVMVKPPNYIITDQDPAMKAAMAVVYTETRHRFCMWHIMTKVTEKVGADLAADDVFLKRLNALVWNEKICVEEFDREWRCIMEKYSLGEHRWFCHMFDLRQFWIPAYFTNTAMSGLLRTTSRSESENSAFGKFTHHHSSLVEFYMQFDSALDGQRHKQRKLDAESESYVPDLKTPLAIKRHAASIYTITVFYEVQIEIVAGCFNCRVVGIREEGSCILYNITGQCKQIYCVQHNPLENNIVCTCNLFERQGILCRHIFLVLKDAQVDKIPPQYVLNRWTKETRERNLNINNGTNNEGCTIGVPGQAAPTVLWTKINECVGLVGNNPTWADRVIQLLEGLIEEFISEETEQEVEGVNRNVIEALCGAQPIGTSTIRPPTKAKNKGSGKRIKGNKEKAIEESTKRKRMCRACNQLARHDSRNCPNI